MSWHDATRPARLSEPEEDRALRAELQGMLGLGQAPASFGPPSAPCQDADALVRSLRQEAIRRRRTGGGQGAPAPKSLRLPLLLAAASVPVLLSITAVGSWGVKQKRRADALEARTLELESIQNRVEAAREGQRKRESLPILQAAEANQGKTPEAKSGSAPSRGTGELVKPEEPPARLDVRPDQHRVNDRR